MQNRKYIKINKLFGKYDNEIDLSNRAIIFIGENGVGKTTIMKILKSLMNYDFLELIKFDFESIDFEVTDINGKTMQYKLKYEELVPTNEDIKSYIERTDRFINELRETWYEYLSETNNENMNISKNDKIMYKAFEDEKIDTPVNIILKDLIKENKLNNLVKEIISNNKINYEKYIEELNIEKDNELKNLLETCLPLISKNMPKEVSAYKLAQIDKYPSFRVQIYHDSNGYTMRALSYDDVKDYLKYIVETIKKYISNKEGKLIDRKKLINIINIIKFDAEELPIGKRNKEVNILDMTKVYTFENALINSSIITNNLLEWKAALPHEYGFISDIIDKKIYEYVYKELENNYYMNEEEFNDPLAENMRRAYKRNSKFISELNNGNTVEINSIINNYFYKEKFVIDFNIKLLKLYIEDETEITSNKNQIDINKFLNYIKPIIIKNSPFDKEFNMEDFIMGKYNNILSFCYTEWSSFEDNMNPKIKVLQELLNKYLMNKDIEVTPMGILIKSNGDNRNIPLNSLSSGEKKLIVIFMHCLFNEDVPIIIDEPEISLSIIWQEDLLPDLLEKTPIKQIIVATHSSAVISNSILDDYIVPLPNSIVDKEENNTNE